MIGEYSNGVGATEGIGLFEFGISLFSVELVVKEGVVLEMLLLGLFLVKEFTKPMVRIVIIK